jgi:hypothetical protein
MQLLFQQLPGRQAGQVFGDLNAASIKFQQFDLFTVLARVKRSGTRPLKTSGLFFYSPWRILTPRA